MTRLYALWLSAASCFQSIRYAYLRSLPDVDMTMSRRQSWCLFGCVWPPPGKVTYRIVRAFGPRVLTNNKEGPFQVRCFAVYKYSLGRCCESSSKLSQESTFFSGPKSPSYYFHTRSNRDIYVSQYASPLQPRCSGLHGLGRHAHRHGGQGWTGLLAQHRYRGYGRHG